METFKIYLQYFHYLFWPFILAAAGYIVQRLAPDLKPAADAASELTEDAVDEEEYESLFSRNESADEARADESADTDGAAESEE